MNSIRTMIVWASGLIESHIEVGHDNAVEALIDWEENVRDHLDEHLSIDWVRA